MKINRRWLAFVALVASAMALAAASIGGASTKGVHQASDASGSIEVWVDASASRSRMRTSSRTRM